MKKHINFYNFQTSLILLLCLLSGLFFAFIVEEHWSRIQSPSMPEEFPFSKTFFYLFCCFSYILQGYALLLLSGHSRKSLYKTAVPLFWGQFVLSLLWLGFFFGLKFFGLALFENFITFMLQVATFSFFRAIQIKAAALLIPAGFLSAATDLINAWFFVV